MASTNFLNSSVSANAYEPTQDYGRPMAIVVSLFFMWAVAVNINDILIPHLKKACNLTDFQSSFIPFVFFGGYFIMARFSGILMKNLGYRKGLVAGLCICAFGAFLFYPAALLLSFPLFLVAIFVMACGNSTLEVGAYPLGASLGRPDKASFRLNLASAFNALGAVLTSLAGRNFILSGVQKSATQLGTMSMSEKTAFRLAEASTVQLPYLILGLIFLAVGAVLYFSKIPEPAEPKLIVEDRRSVTPHTDRTSFFQHQHLLLGVLAIFFYVGAQVGIASFIFRYTEFRISGITEKAAALYITYHLMAFMAGRFVGTALQQKILPRHLLAGYAVSSFGLVLIAILSESQLGVWAVVGIGFFHSIMFPTIFALALAKLGGFTKDGSTYLVMAIVGGAVIPLVMGYVSDATSILTAFTVPGVCYLYIFFYAIKGYKIVEPKVYQLEKV